MNLPDHNRDSFSVAYTLGYFGIDVHKNVERMLRGIQGVAEERWPPIGKVYLRHPDDFVLRKILQTQDDGAGEENRLFVIRKLFYHSPATLLRVSRTPHDLETLMESFDVGYNFSAANPSNVEEIKTINGIFRRLSRNGDPRVARAARYCLAQRRIHSRHKA